MILNNTGLINQSVGVKTYQLVQYVTGFMEGDINDWPPVIQDKINEALEKKAKEVQHPLVIVFSQCGVEHKYDEEGQDRFYVQVIASEIVVADERTVRKERDRIAQIVAEIMNESKTRH